MRLPRKHYREPYVPGQGYRPGMWAEEVKAAMRHENRVVELYNEHHREHRLDLPHPELDTLHSPLRSSHGR